MKLAVSQGQAVQDQVTTEATRDRAKKEQFQRLVLAWGRDSPILTRQLLRTNPQAIVEFGENITEKNESDSVNKPAGAGNIQRDGAKSLGGFEGDAETLQRNKSNAVDSATNAGTAPGGANSRVTPDKDAPLAD